MSNVADELEKRLWQDYQLTHTQAHDIAALLHRTQLESQLEGAQYVRSELLASPKDSWYGTLDETIERLQAALEKQA